MGKIWNDMELNAKIVCTECYLEYKYVSYGICYIC